MQHGTRLRMHVRRACVYPHACIAPCRHSYTKKQRRCILGAGIGLAALCAVLIALIALAALRGGSRTMGDLKTGDMPEQTEAGSTGSEQPATGSPPAAPSTAQPSASELELCSWQEYRLPRRVLPSTYNLVRPVVLECICNQLASLCGWHEYKS